MPRIYFLFTLLLLFAVSGISFAQQGMQPIKWKAYYSELTDSTGEILIKADLEPNWHTYSQVKLSNDGPLPTVFRFVKTVDYDLSGNVIEPDPIRIHSDVFDADVAMFSIEAIFTQKIHRNTKKSFEILAEVECMMCNDSQCLPPRITKFVIKVPQNELK
ncbi:MAG: protein-disulfide reductase DsbD domain-containing protein [Bacteroidia bacterium]